MYRLKFSALPLLGAFLIGLSVIAQSPEEPVDRARIARVIETLTSKDHRQIANLIDYPLGRGYPIKPIRNKHQCLKRFDELFDDALLSEIGASSPKDDWQRIGWRGIIFKNGALWLNDDYKISAINHETEKSKAVRAKLIADQKKNLPPALRDFDEPELEWTTQRYLIRVDRKVDDYRLVLFKRGTRTNPLQVLSHGIFRFDGELGSYQIDWQFEGRTYRVYSSADDDSGDCFYVYNRLVGESEYPDHPALEQKRLGPPR